MGLKEYLGKRGYGSRMRICLSLALLFHGLAFAGSGLLLETKADYGMAGAVAGGGNPRPVTPPTEATVDLEDDVPSDAPVPKKQKPIPTPQAHQGMGGPTSGGALEVPSYYRNPPPPYPDDARRLQQEGLVTLRVQVDAQGQVASVALLKSSGFPLLDGSALETLKTWRFKPARMAGIAVSTSVDVPVRFRLKDIR